MKEKGVKHELLMGLGKTLIPIGIHNPSKKQHKKKGHRCFHQHADSLGM